MVNAVKVFKKNAPNGKITVYLGRRDFVDNTTSTEPVDGVVVVDHDYLRGRKVYAAVTVTYRFGREEDEIMGLHFSKELQLTCQEIYPKEEKIKTTEVQEKLLKKLGSASHPFAVIIPENAPCSVQLHPGSEGTAKPLGVIYELKVYVADNTEERPHRRNSVTLAVRKVQFSPQERFNRQPSTLATKGFTFTSGKLTMELSLEKELYYHGEQVKPAVTISNNSKKTVKGMKCCIIQHVEVTMTNAQFNREVASLETREGCPIMPGGRFQKTFHIMPLAANRNKFGIALDGKMKDTDANLASSTVMKEGTNPNDALGIVVSYSVRVRINCGALGGELVADLPFKLMHPAPDCVKSQSEDIEFEDFARLRRGRKKQPTSMVNAVKVFKKTAPNGKITVYLGRRDFVDNTTGTEPVDGVVVVDNDYLRGRKVYASVTVTYRFGREEDEVMGLSFSKEMQLASQQIYPSTIQSEPNGVQDRLIKKLGANAYPFAVTLPEHAPCSVQLHSGEDESTKPLGVIYDLRVFVGDNSDEKPHRRNSVALAVRKVQFSPPGGSKRQPSTLVSKGFALSSGKLNMEVTLDKELYYHGEQVKATLSVNNASKKTVKNVKCAVIQHVELTMTNNHFSREVACLESKEGCPVTPGSNLHKTFNLTPVASSNKNKYGIALDGKLKDTDANLASSTIVAAGKNANDALGIVVTYSLRVKLSCGAIGGELVADLPFKLMHPTPGATIKARPDAGYAGGEDLEFEDFARLRRGESVDQN
ncbi:uncharacterized protein [Panulirus ornatus]|uniref:uncharacterized protein n=1 Tax=Panulirus ornatus TaxID=150431 RepID=UPI003A8A1AAF